MSASLPPGATRLLHHRDAGLDEPWGEGEELDLFLSDGRFFLERTFVHIDADGPRVTAGFVGEGRALEILAEHGSPEVRRLFPGSWQARALERFGTCRLEDLRARSGALAQEAEKIPHPPAGRECMRRAGIGIYLRTDGDGGLSLLAPEEALPHLLRLGVDAETLGRLFPDSREGLLLSLAGAATWSALEAGALTPLLASAARLHTRVDPEAETEGWVREESLYRLDADLHVHERRRVGREAPAYEALDRAGALFALVSMPDVPEAVKAAAFPDRETWLEAQRRCGISFGG